MKLYKMKYLLGVGLTCSLSMMAIQACKKDFLDPKPYGQYGSEQLKNKRGIEGLLIGVYGVLDGQGTAGAPWETAANNWATAGVAADDAYKGTDANDQPQMTEVELYRSQAANPYFYDKWLALYEGIARANDVIRLASDPEINDLTEDDRKNIIGQARFLRGHYHFDAKKNWNKVPYVSETATEKYDNAKDIWPEIEADFKYAFDNLPETQNAASKANKWAAAAYLGKVYLYQKKYVEAKGMFDQVIANGKTAGGQKYALLDAYWKNFDAAYDNNSEGVFVVSSAASGSVDGSGERSMGLAFPYGGEFGCCGFFQPSQNLVNAHRTDAGGLPLFDTFNSVDVKNDQGVKSDDAFTTDQSNLDPRLDWSVGRRGIYYWDWGTHPGYSWIRDQAYAGPYSPKKHVFAKRDMGSLTSSGWKNITAKDIHIIRYADVLLMAAEAEIEAGSLEKAREYVNMVRDRAADERSWVKSNIENGDVADANYVISRYTTAWADPEYARKAVRFERRLELAMEGHRFYDLVRWGIAAEVLNAYVAKEKSLRVYKASSSFTKGKNEYFPIPARIIELAAKSGGNIVQNPGY